MPCLLHGPGQPLERFPGLTFFLPSCLTRDVQPRISRHTRKNALYTGTIAYFVCFNGYYQ
jgi:hypothetical protein